MNRFGMCLLTFVVLLSPAPYVAAQIAPSETNTPKTSGYVPVGYSLVFSDDFDQSGLDEAKWKIRYEDGKAYLAGFTSDASVVQPSDGFLHLVTTYDQDNDKFLTGMVRSKDEFQYGYYGARIRFQSLQGHHGAFWLQSSKFGEYPDDPAKSGAEIDIVEFFGNRRTEEDTQHNVYWNKYESPNKKHVGEETSFRNENDVELSDDFHIFSLLWTADEYVFFIDGVETWRTSEGVSQQPEYIVLSLVTADWEQKALQKNKSQLPNEMLVDCVRVYTKQDG